MPEGPPNGALTGGGAGAAAAAAASAGGVGGSGACEASHATGGDGGHGIGNGRDECGCGRATADDHDFLVFANHASIPLLRMNDLALVTLHSLELRGVALL